MTGGGAQLGILLTMRDEASAALGAFQKQASAAAKNVADSWQAVGKTFTVAGGAMTALAGVAVKSSLEQQVGINRLNQALKNVGESYAAQKTSIEAVISAQQRKTNFSDEQQRDALQKLVTIGGQWGGSLQALKITTDVAAGANVDLNAAALLVGKAIAGETGSLSRYGIVLKEGASQTEIMAALTRQFGGAAEAAVNPMVQLKNRLDDMMQVMGDALLPIVSRAAQVIGNIAEKVQGWAEAHPELAKWLSIVAAALGGVMLVVGPLLLALPALIAGVAAFGTVLAVAMGPVGLITIAIAGLVAGALLLWKNWDTVWSGIKSVTEKVVNFLITGFNTWTFVYRQGLAALLMAVRAVAGVFSDEFAAKVQVAIDALRRGIPTVDITRERVQELGTVTKQAASEVGTALGSVQEGFRNTTAIVKQSVAEIAEANRKANEALLDENELTWAEQVALFLRSLQKETRLIVDERELQARREEFWANHILEQTRRGLADKLAITQQARNDEIALTERVNRLLASMNADMVRGNADSARRNAEAQRTASESIQRNWQGLRDATDPVLSKIRDLGVNAELVVNAWAKTVGVSAGQIITHLQGMGIEHNDLAGMVHAFANAVGKGWEDAAASAAAGAKSVLASIESVAASVARNFTQSGQRAFRTIQVAGQIVGVVASDPSVVPARLQLPSPVPVHITSTGQTVTPPTFQRGGIVPGPIGQPQLATVHGGEVITPVGRGLGSTIIIQGPLISVSGNLLGTDVEDLVHQAMIEIARRTGLRLGMA